MKLPHPTARNARTDASSVIDEECELEEKQIKNARCRPGNGLFNQAGAA
jgi:hypothetical protein